MSRNPNWTRDELILALDLYFRVDPVHTSKKNPEIVQLSDFLNRLPVHDRSSQRQTFRNPDGVYMKLCNFLRLDPGYSGKGLDAGSTLDVDVWNEFGFDRDRLSAVAEAIRRDYQLLVPTSQTGGGKTSDDDEEFPEGRILARLHRARERNPRAARKKKDQVLSETGRLSCEVCTFDFREFYGDMGYGVAECHHDVPISDPRGSRKTKLSELSIICPNCHRIIHKRRPWLKVEDLRAVLSERGKLPDLLYCLQ